MIKLPFRLALLPIAVSAAIPLMLAGCNDDGDDSSPVAEMNVKPTFVAGSISEKSYDGSSDDLLTAGLGKTGIGGSAPVSADPSNPTATELRRLAIYNNYRALIDYSANGGYGSLYGPNVDSNGVATTGEGKIAGSEHIAYSDDGSGKQNVTLMVQVPATFNSSAPCIVTATSSGSRGIYGAIGTAGDWGLKHGCAVAYTDKGSGNGVHDLATDKVNQQDGRLVSASTAASSAIFRTNLSSTELASFNTAFPNRVAYKHAHSQQNPEKDWGKNTLQAVEFAFYVLNEKYGTAINGGKTRSLKPDNTLVIASSVSNGGGAALAAAEQDTQGLIDGIAVAEPNAQPGANAGLTIKQGASVVATHSKPLIDYFTYANLYQPCAALSAAAGGGTALAAAFWPAAYTKSAQNRCSALRNQGMITGDTLEAQADAALAKLNAYGWQSETNFFQQSHFRFATNSIAVTYVNTYGRFSVADNVCGFSFANTNATGDVIAQVANTTAALFGTGNGVPPTSGINIVYNDSVGGAKLDFLSVSPTSGLADFAFDGALCLRSLVTGKHAVTGAALTGTQKTQSDRVIAGINEVQLTANLHGKPTVIVAGRNDTLVPINHAARAYVGKNQLLEGTASNVRYYEVLNAQHFDTFIAFGSLLGYDTRVVPLHVYFNQAMDLMWAKLKNNVALPASQVVRTTPRAASTEALTKANVPAISANPRLADQISFSNASLAIPD